MTMAKRFSLLLLAFALCAVMSLGSLSFMPKSSAVSYADVEVPYILSELVSSYSPNFVWLSYSSVNGSVQPVVNLTKAGSMSVRRDGSSGDYGRVTFASFISNVRLLLNSNIFVSDNYGSYSIRSLGFPVPAYSSGGGFTLQDEQYLNKFSYSFLPEPTPPISSVPRFLGYNPFFFPEMPHGYFDGNINVVDGTYNIDFPSNASISGAITQTGNDHYTWTWNHGTLYWNGETVQGEHEGWLSPDYQRQTPPIGDITQTAYANRLINLSLSDLDSVVNYTPAYNENSRFRCWSCVMDSSYVWFVSDTRNKITGSIVSVTSNEVKWKYEFSDPQGGNTIYPTWAIVFSPMGEVIQVLSPTTVANKNTYNLSCSIGTLEHDDDTGIWSCDPLYHGFWFSDDSPPVANITHLNVAENKKYLANPVFGESAFQLQFLDSINLGIADINTNIQSLQSAMQSSISGQTSAFQNMDAPSAPQPSTSHMMDYFSKESAFSAPNTDEVFSGDIKSGHYWDGVTWWSTKFNDIIVSNQVIVAFTTAMLTLGLAVLIIGRRFSMR